MFACCSLEWSITYAAMNIHEIYFVRVCACACVCVFWQAVQLASIDFVIRIHLGNLSQPSDEYLLMLRGQVRQQGTVS